MASFNEWIDDNELNVLLLWRDEKRRIIMWADKPRNWFAPQRIILPSNIVPSENDMEVYKEL